MNRLPKAVVSIRLVETILSATLPFIRVFSITWIILFRRVQFESLDFEYTFLEDEVNSVFYLIMVDRSCFLPFYGTV